MAYMLVGMLFMLGMMQLVLLGDFLGGVTSVVIAIVSDISHVFPNDPVFIPLVVLEYVLLWLCLEQLLPRWEP